MGAPSNEVELGQANLIAFNRAQARWSTKGAVEEVDGCVLCAGGSWLPVVANSAFRTGPAVSGSDLIAHAGSFFGGFARGFAVKVRDTGEDDDLRDSCAAAGLEQFGTPVPQMIVMGPLPDHRGVDGVALAPVDDEAGIADFVAVNAEAYATYGMPGEVLPELFDEAKAVVDDPAAHVVVARRDGVAVATAMTFESDGVASVQWVGTVSIRPRERPRRPGHHVGHQLGVRARRIVVHVAGVADGRAHLPLSRLRDDLPLRRVRALAQAAGAFVTRVRR